MILITILLTFVIILFVAYLAQVTLIIMNLNNNYFDTKKEFFLSFIPFWELLKKIKELK
jgi:hypothetical protein